MRTVLTFLLMYGCSLQFALSEGPDALFQRYVRSLLNGETKNAEACWDPGEIKRSNRLGITYAGVNAKYDCASPVYGTLEQLRLHPEMLSTGTVKFADSYAELPVTIAAGRETLHTVYYFSRKGNDWRIISPLTRFAAQWKRIDSRYVRLFYSDERMVNPAAVAELDSTIGSLCRTFALSAEAEQKLRREKFEYYLTDDAAVRIVTGVQTKGLADLQRDAVISSVLPHRHELTHLFMNYRLHDLPLFTLPWLQEGTAVSFGGRWGKSPEVMLQLGKILFDGTMVSVDDLLTYRGFHGTVGNPDLSYPASGLFVKFLTEQYGTERFISIYRSLSGTMQDMERLTADSVRTCITAAAGTSWERIINDFTTFTARYSCGRIVPGTVSAKRSISELSSNGTAVNIFESDSMLLFEVRLDTARQNSTISILSLPQDHTPSNYRSPLFSEHFPERNYRGERFAIRISKSEAGVYDYYTDILLAKFVRAFFPEQDTSYNSYGVLYCMIPKHLVPEGLLRYSLCLSVD